MRTRRECRGEPDKPGGRRSAQWRAGWGPTPGTRMRRGFNGAPDGPAWPPPMTPRRRNGVGQIEAPSYLAHLTPRWLLGSRAEWAGSDGCE
eukprot:1593073-Pyramimonas_sp.AAC.1